MARKVENELMEYIPPDTNPQLKLHTLEYLYDTVGWALYCTGAMEQEPEGPPEPGEQTIELGEDGKAAGTEEERKGENVVIGEEVQEAEEISSVTGKGGGGKRPIKKKKKDKGGSKPLKVKKEPWDEYRLLRKSLKDVYRSKDDYLNYLREQYDKEIQFYQAILRGERSYAELYPELDELGIFDSDMEEEVESATRGQLEELTRNLRDETAIIKAISDKDWERIRRSPNPKITLALVLGADPKDIRENFHSSLLVRMRAQRMGQRTAFYSWQGPKMWTGLEDFEVQVDRVVEAVLDPIIAYETAGILEEGLKRNKK
jgi:hypothetical protein